LRIATAKRLIDFPEQTPQQRASCRAIDEDELHRGTVPAKHIPQSQLGAIVPRHCDIGQLRWRHRAKAVTALPGGHDAAEGKRTQKELESKDHRAAKTL
jgi:hypothetical protein